MERDNERAGCGVRENTHSLEEETNSKQGVPQLPQRRNNTRARLKLIENGPCTKWEGAPQEAWAQMHVCAPDTNTSQERRGQKNSGCL